MSLAEAIRPSGSQVAADEGLVLIESAGATTGFTGVIEYTGNPKQAFIARRKVNGRHQHLGLFRSAAEAALAYARHVGSDFCMKKGATQALRRPTLGAVVPYKDL